MLFDRVIKAVEKQNPEYVFITGDLTNQGNDIELENVRRRLCGFSTPVYVIPGNHETTWSESAGKTWTSYRRIGLEFKKMDGKKRKRSRVPFGYQ